MKKLFIGLLVFVVVGCSQQTEELDLGKVKADYVLGNASAPVQIVEYSDFQCEFCGDFHQDVFPKLKEDYIDTNRISYVFRDFPLISVHKSAFVASKATYCAGDQGRYWSMVEQLFANQEQLAVQDLIGYADQVGVRDLVLFEACLRSDKYDDTVEGNLVDGANGGIKGPPTFFVNELKIEGAQPYEAFKDVIDQELARF